MSATREVWGAEVSLLTLAAALRARGVDVAVVALPGELAEQAHLAGHQVHVADPGSETRRVLVAGALWREYMRHVQPGDRLVLFSYILTAWAPRYRRRLSARGVRVSLDLHDQLESRKAFWSVRVASEAVDTVIACSAFTAAQMGAREGVYALHRPVTTDLADTGMPSVDHTVSTPSRSTAHRLQAGADEITRADAAAHSASGAEELLAARRSARAGVADEEVMRHADHGAGSEPHPARGGRGAARRPASRTGLLGGAAPEPPTTLPASTVTDGRGVTPQHSVSGGADASGPALPPDSVSRETDATGAALPPDSASRETDATGAALPPGSMSQGTDVNTRVEGLERPLGLHPSNATHPPEKKRRIRVGIVGRISREKRHELVVAAMSLVDRDMQLVVRGSAFGEAREYAAEVYETGERLLGPRFVDEGRVPAAEALTGLDAVVVGNPAEPMGRTVLEAQLRGIVAVVPNTGGSCELVEHGRTGLVYAANDVDDLARTLRRLADEPELVARIARDAVDSVPRPAEYAAAYLSRLG